MSTNITTLSYRIAQLHNPLLHHALLPSASQLVIPSLIVKFAVYSLTPAPQTHVFINKLFQRTTPQFLLTMTYRFFCFQVQLHPWQSWLWKKIRFPEFNRNIVIDKHPTLIVDSMNLQYNIILGANFLDKCGITLDYENHQVKWLEYTITPKCFRVFLFCILHFNPFTT